jgi:hypothetical protein
MDVIGNGMKSYLIKLGKLLLLLVTGLFLSVQHIAAEPSATDLTADQKTDLDTGAIEPTDSVENNPDLIYVLELLLRAPVSQLKDGEPPYDQEPPDAQDDFRTRVEPPMPTEPPVPPPMPSEPPMPPPPLPTEPPPTVPTRPPLFPGFPVDPPDDRPPRPNDPPSPDNPSNPIN